MSSLIFALQTVFPKPDASVHERLQDSLIRSEKWKRSHLFGRNRQKSGLSNSLPVPVYGNDQVCSSTFPPPDWVGDAEAGCSLLLPSLSVNPKHVPALLPPCANRPPPQSGPCRKPPGADSNESTRPPVILTETDHQCLRDAVRPPVHFQAIIVGACRRHPDQADDLRTGTPPRGGVPSPPIIITPGSGASHPLPPSPWTRTRAGEPLRRQGCDHRHPVPWGRAGRPCVPGPPQGGGSDGAREMTRGRFVVLTGGLAGFHPLRRQPLPGAETLWQGVRALGGVPAIRTGERLRMQGNDAGSGMVH